MESSLDWLTQMRDGIAMSQERYEAVMAQVRERQEKLREDLAAYFSEHPSCVLEIGCGHGHFLTAYAAAHPQQTCLGIDIVSKRIAKSERKADVNALNNLSFMKAEVREFFACLPESAKLDRVFMLFPDPWPKKRHHKNRMIQHALLSSIAEHCEPGTSFCYRTDHEGYFDWTTEHLAEHPDWEIDAEEPWPFECGSFFQDLMDSYQSVIAKRA